MNKLPQPLNVVEELLYGINKRTEVLIEQVSSLLEYIAQRDKVAVESGKVETYATVADVPDEAPIVAPIVQKETRKKRGG